MLATGKIRNQPCNKTIEEIEAHGILGMASVVRQLVVTQYTHHKRILQARSGSDKANKLEYFSVDDDSGKSGEDGWSDRENSHLSVDRKSLTE